MTTIAIHMFKALKQAGVDEELATKAAEEVAAHDQDIAQMRNDITAVRGTLGKLQTLLVAQMFGLLALFAGTAWKVLHGS